MRCPYCANEESAVLESRVSVEADSLRRRRECSKCHQRFTTYERVEGPVLMVIKKDGRREAFDTNKLAKGIRVAFYKRPVPVETLDQMVDEIERELRRKGEREVASRLIGRAGLKRIKKLDKVAWLRFASVYLEFEDVSDFEKMINKMTVNGN